MCSFEDSLEEDETLLDLRIDMHVRLGSGSSFAETLMERHRAA